MVQFWQTVPLIPMAQKLENHAKREALNNELIIEGVVFIQKGGNPRLLSDLLSSFLSPKVNKNDLQPRLTRIAFSYE